MGTTLRLKATRVADSRSELGESPVWDDRAGVLRWIDGPAGVVHGFEPGAGELPALHLAEPVAAIALRANGALLVAHHRRLVLHDRGGELCRFALATSERLNDGAADRFGTYWIGSVSEERCGRLYRISTDGTVTVALAGIGMSNGIDWSPAGDVMYYVDTATQRIDRLAVDSTGSPRAPQPFATIPRRTGVPDGLAVDAAGGVWVAVWGAGEVRRYLPDGSLERIVDVPAPNVTSCAFGGADLRTLYITSARQGIPPDVRQTDTESGALFAVALDVPGRRAPRFGG